MRSLFLFVFMLFFGVHSFASHLVSGAISYKSLGNKRYEIRVVLLRDRAIPDGQAQATPFDPQIQIGIFSATTNQEVANPMILNLSQETLTTLTSKNHVSTNIDFAFGLYKGILDLSNISLPVYITFARCCISNTVNIAPEQGFTLVSYIPKETNTLQTQIGLPLVVAAGKDFSFDLSDKDENGDSITYKLVTPYYGGDINEPLPQPKGGPYNNILWNTGYNENNILGTNNTLQINATTGVLSGNCNTLGRFGFALEKTEYRNGNQLSKSRKQLHLITSNLETTDSLYFDPVPDWNFDSTSTVGFPGEMNINTGILVYPNPFQKTVAITGVNYPFQYTITNVFGKILTAGEATDKTINGLENLKPGMYILNVKAGEKIINIKLLKN